MSEHVQDLTFESGNIARVEQMLRLAVEMQEFTVLLKQRPDLITQYPSEATAFSSSFVGRPFDGDIAKYKRPDQRGPAFYRPICRLRRFGGASGYDELVEGDLVTNAMALIRAADVAAFEAETGEGPFRGSDGVVTIGYRLHLGISFDLQICLCHIYHPR